MPPRRCPVVCDQLKLLTACKESEAWAARYNTGLVIKLKPNGVDFFSFFSRNQKQR